MKHLHFIFVGKPKEPAFKELELLYSKKISRYLPVTFIFIKDSSEKNLQLKRKKETKEILSRCKPDDFLVVCDERGESFSSKKFAQKIQNWRENYKSVTFVVGGAFGLDLDLLTQKYVLLKLSEFVLPHELARVVLEEQVYRALTIMAGENYHHE